VTSPGTACAATPAAAITQAFTGLPTVATLTFPENDTLTALRPLVADPTEAAVWGGESRAVRHLPGGRRRAPGREGYGRPGMPGHESASMRPEHSA